MLDNKKQVYDDLLKKTKTVAIVGLSNNPLRPSYKVASYLKSVGLTIIPVNPTIQSVLGEKSYPDLLSIGKNVDVVDVFRKSEHVPEIVRQSIQIGARVIWMQEGIFNNSAAKEARRHDMVAVENKCMMKEYKKYSSV